MRPVDGRREMLRVFAMFEARQVRLGGRRSSYASPCSSLSSSFLLPFATPLAVNRRMHRRYHRS
jgi:hypothetical protein